MYSSYEKIPILIPPRIYVFLIALLCGFFLIAARLWYLQVIKGASFAEQSKNNRQRTVSVPPARGIIRDRLQHPLATNRPAFNIQMYLQEVREVDSTLEHLANILEISSDTLHERLAKQGGPRFRPRVLLRDASREQVERVLSNRLSLPGISVGHYPIRFYEYGSLAAHVIGHVREISKGELLEPDFRGYYQRGDVIGKYGLENAWELYLQGRRGRNSFLVNAHSVKIQDLPDQTKAIPGNILQLTIDRDIQRAADEALVGQWGAVVAMVPQTGEILALASAPTFDPNIFTGEVTQAQWDALTKGRERTLTNRVVQEVYPPGSVFKTFLGVAGLEEGLITEKTTEYCPGFHTVGNRTFKCHKRDGHGTVNLQKALTVSCDVFFYILGQRLGIERIHDYASQFGLGEVTGIDLVQESKGLIPSTEWKRKRYAGTDEARWFPGETPSVAIGQGATSATPIQLAVAMSTLVNGGTRYRPYLVQGVYSNDGKTEKDSFGPKAVGQLTIDKRHLAHVTKVLESVVHGKQGTARLAQLPSEWKIQVGGKTGTSQVVALQSKTEKREHEHHALFAGYAPVGNPEIVVVAVVEHGGSGGAAAAPVVRQVLEAYFMKNRGLSSAKSSSREHAQGEQ
jgi:penicillin-binding protein 2